MPDIVNYSHHAVHYIPWLTYFITRSSYLLTPFIQCAHPTPYLCPGQPLVCFLYLWECFCFIDYTFTRASLVAQRVERLPATQETQVWSLGYEDPLEKEMATHPSILAWRIPWTEELSGLQSTGSQRVGHDWVTDRPPRATHTIISSSLINNYHNWSFLLDYYWEITPK